VARDPKERKGGWAHPGRLSSGGPMHLFQPSAVRLGCGANKRTGRGAGGTDVGKGKKGWGQWRKYRLLAFPDLNLPACIEGPSRGHGIATLAAGSRSLPVNRVTAQPSICFLLLLTLSSRVRCQKSFHELLCPLHKTVRTSSRPSSPPSLTPVHLSPIYSLLGRKLPRLL
jgi:hypothetical protein